MPIYAELGAQRITIDSTAGGVKFTLPASTVGVTYYAACRVETAQIRESAAVTVTAAGTNGDTLRDVGDEFEVWGGADLNAWRAIRTTATSGVVTARYFGVKA